MSAAGHGARAVGMPRGRAYWSLGMAGVVCSAVCAGLALVALRELWPVSLAVAALSAGMVREWALTGKTLRTARGPWSSVLPSTLVLFGGLALAQTIALVVWALWDRPVAMPAGSIALAVTLVVLEFTAAGLFSASAMAYAHRLRAAGLMNLTDSNATTDRSHP